jgi:hypothetical protein
MKDEYIFCNLTKTSITKEKCNICPFNKGEKCPHEKEAKNV